MAFMTYDVLKLFKGAVLMQMSPKPEEAQALQAYDGPRKELSEPERFLLALSHVPVYKRSSAPSGSCSNLA